MEEDPSLNRRLRDIQNILIVLSGKGGVGKSSVSVQLAFNLLSKASKNFRVGILDIDLTGPSIPRMLGLQGRSVHQSTDGWVPVQKSIEIDISDHERHEYDNGEKQNQGQEDHNSSSSEKRTVKGTLKCMSIGFLMKDHKRDSVLWRGPKKNSMIKQFLCNVRWGELDWLVIDTPPGTSDEHITLLEQLSPLIINSTINLERKGALPSLSSILVTTPQAVSLSDVSKEYDFTKKVGLRVIGLIENMSGYVCPHCKKVQNVFGSGGGESFCLKINDDEKNLNVGEVPENKNRIEFLGKVPIDVQLMKLLDNQDDDEVGPEENAIEDQMIKNYNEVDYELFKKYSETESSSRFDEICEKVIKAVECLRKEM
ncbi:nucleotide-binding protein 2 [Phakopsora pachyrhizi]|nr:nucleotide-binding protein 2 [Phakopsora pachyrhizi]